MLMLERRSSSRASQCQCFVSCSSGCTTQRQARLIVCRQLLLQTTFHSGGKLVLSTSARQWQRSTAAERVNAGSVWGRTMAERVDASVGVTAHNPKSIFDEIELDSKGFISCTISLSISKVISLHEIHICSATKSVFGKIPVHALRRATCCYKRPCRRMRRTVRDTGKMTRFSR